jgi:glycerate kinase
MKVVIAPQTFKGGLSGPEVARAIEQGVLRACSNAVTVRIPVADGGDGTLDALVRSTDGELFTNRVTGPLGESVSAQWGVMGDKKTAVIEMARASGLALVPLRMRDPRTTTTYGTGELMVAALDRGYRRIIVGLGGSATTDGGIGMAQALGVRFLDPNGRELPFGGTAAVRLARIDMSGLRLGVMEAKITAATDVTNPLCGPKGAAAIFGPQKGATSKMVQELDMAMDHLAQTIKRSLGLDLRDIPRGGAAGGLAAGLIAFANAEVVSGIDLVCDVLTLDQHLAGADLVITAEGRLDSSTAYDKAPVGVARRAKARGIPVVAIAGSLGQGYEEVYRCGIDAVVPILERPMTFEDSLARTSELVINATERAMRLLALGLRLPTVAGPTSAEFRRTG